MISIVTSVCNAKLDFDQFVRQLHELNDPQGFEIVVAHDDRVNDGSGTYLALLAREFPAVRVVYTHTKTDAVSRVRAVLESRKDQMDEVLRGMMLETLNKYESGEEWDGTREYLWLSPSYLLGQAADAALGDYILITSCDWLSGFRLADLENAAISHTTDGYFYARLPLMMANITNEPEETVERQWQDMRNKGPTQRISSHSGYSLGMAQRCYDLFSKTVGDYRLVDPRNGSQIRLDAYGFVDNVDAIRGAAVPGQLVPLCQEYTGLHLISKKVWEASGGYPTDILGRCTAEDVLIGRCAPWYHGNVLADFPMLNARRHGIPGNADQAACLAVDPQVMRHPIPWANNERHLCPNSRMVDEIETERQIYGLPVTRTVQRGQAQKKPNSGHGKHGLR